MFRKLGVLFLVLSTLTTFAFDERKLYVGKNSTEATLTFSFHVEIKSEKVPTKEEIDDALDSQAYYLFGPMGVAESKGVPKGDRVFSEVSNPVLKAGTKDTYEVSYKYKGTIIVENSAQRDYSVILPFNPETIYEAAKVGGKVRCITDAHYDEDDDFWYFWNPAQAGCKLVEGEQYATVQGEITRIPSTKATYPEYDRLVRTVSGKKEITLSILMGMDDEEKSHNPLTSKDINASNFREVRKSLVQMGFIASKPWSHKQMETHLNHKIDGDVYVEELVKSTPKAVIVARMFFGPSGMDEASEAFHYFYKEALESQSVMVYDGHSGLGAHLDLKAMEEKRGFTISPDPKNYQIYYFNSCSSYTYYNTQYFGRKINASDPKGTKNLDILTNGLATYFSVMHDTNMAVVKAIDLWATGKGSATFQVLAKEIDSENLFGINGDEDNPTTPVR